jgi:hypothetical protein
MPISGERTGPETESDRVSAFPVTSSSSGPIGGQIVAPRRWRNYRVEGHRTNDSWSACGSVCDWWAACDAEGAPARGRALGSGRSYLKASLIFSPACLRLPLA